jgi:hypothetical protein
VVAAVVGQSPERGRDVRGQPRVAEPPGQHQPVLQVRFGAGVVAPVQEHAPQHGQTQRRGAGVADAAVDRQAVQVRGARGRQVAPELAQQAAREEAEGDAMLIAQRGRHGDAGLAPGRRLVELAKVRVHDRRADQRAGERLAGGGRVGQGQQLLVPAPPLAVVAARRPEVVERGRQAQAVRGVPTLAAPPQRGAQVVVLGVGPPHESHAAAHVELDLGPLGQRQVPVAVPIAHRLDLAGLGQPLPAILPHRLEQPVARLVAARLGLHQRLGDQLEEQLEHVVRDHLAAGGDGLGGLEREAAGEDRQPAPERPLGRRQQVVAPPDHRAQRLVPGQGGAAPLGQEAEAVVQASGDLLRGQSGHPRGGQLDRERYAVEPPADLDDARGVPLGQVEAGQRAPRPLDEQPRGLGALRVRPRVHAVGARAARLRHAQRRHPPPRLAGNAEGLAAGCQDPEAGAAPEKRVRERGARVDEVLAVVEHEQEPPRPQVVDQRFVDGPVGLVGQAERGGDGPGDQRRRGDRRQIDEPDPVRVVARQPVGDLDREARLADPARPGQRDQAGHGEERADLGALRLAPDEAGRAEREVAPRPGGVPKAVAPALAQQGRDGGEAGRLCPVERPLVHSQRPAGGRDVLALDVPPPQHLVDPATPGPVARPVRRPQRLDRLQQRAPQRPAQRHGQADGL